MEKKITEQQKQEGLKVINMMYKHMASGLYANDPEMAQKWDARKPEAFVDKHTGNPGFTMYCKNYELTLIVEYNYSTRLYLLSVKKDDRQIEPIGTVLAPEAIAAVILEYMNSVETK